MGGFESMFIEWGGAYQRVSEAVREEEGPKLVIGQWWFSILDWAVEVGGFA